MLYYTKNAQDSPYENPIRIPQFPCFAYRILYPLYERDNTNTIANIIIFRKNDKKNNDFFRQKIPPPSRKALFISILYIQLIVLKNDKGIVVGRGHGDTFGRQRNRPRRNGRQNRPKRKISRCNSATWRKTHLFHRDGSKKTAFREIASRAVGVKNPFRAAYGGPR